MSRVGNGYFQPGVASRKPLRGLEERVLILPLAVKVT